MVKGGERERDMGGKRVWVKGEKKGVRVKGGERGKG